jgi:hypothetical protein
MADKYFGRRLIDSRVYNINVLGTGVEESPAIYRTWRRECSKLIVPWSAVDISACISLNTTAASSTGDPY